MEDVDDILAALAFVDFSRSPMSRGVSKSASFRSGHTSKSTSWRSHVSRSGPLDKDPDDDGDGDGDGEGSSAHPHPLISAGTRSLGRMKLLELWAAQDQADQDRRLRAKGAPTTPGPGTTLIATGGRRSLGSSPVCSPRASLAALGGRLSLGSTPPNSRQSFESNGSRHSLGSDGSRHSLPGLPGLEDDVFGLLDGEDLDEPAWQGSAPMAMPARRSASRSKLDIEAAEERLQRPECLSLDKVGPGSSPEMDELVERPPGPTVRFLQPVSRRGTPLENLTEITEPLDRVLLMVTRRDSGSTWHQYLTTEEALAHAASGSMEFDSFQLSELTDHRPLSTLGMHLFRVRNLIADLQIDEAKLQRFLNSVEDKMQDHPYHNRVHITDVLQAVHAETLPGGGLEYLCKDQPLHLVAVLMAAVIHDLDHPGVNNDFLIKSNHPLAQRYPHGDGQGVAEQHHLELALGLLRQPECQFLGMLSMDQWQLVWGIVREMVLNTDMKRHMPFLQDLKKWVGQGRNSADDVEDECEAEMSLVTVAMKCSIAMKCADLGHTVRPARLHIMWTKAVTTEFYQQGDREAREGLPVTQGMFRPGDEAEVYQSQAWFLGTHVQPLYEEWASFSQSSRGEEMVASLKANIREWEALAKERQEAHPGSRSPTASALLSKIRDRRKQKPSLTIGALRKSQNGSLVSSRGSSHCSSPMASSAPRFSSSMRNIPIDQYLDTSISSDGGATSPGLRDLKSPLLDSLQLLCESGRSKSVSLTRRRSTMGAGITLPQRRHSATADNQMLSSLHGDGAGALTDDNQMPSRLHTDGDGKDDETILCEEEFPAVL